MRFSVTIQLSLPTICISLELQKTIKPFIDYRSIYTPQIEFIERVVQTIPVVTHCTLINLSKLPRCLQELWRNYILNILLTYAVSVITPATILQSLMLA